MKNKRGLSAVVATLIIILLVLVAVGILWAVINNVIEGGSETIEYNQLCAEVDFREIEVSESTGGVYDVRFQRGTTGEEIDGLTIVLRNEAGNSSGTLDFTENIDGGLNEETMTFDTGGSVTNANEMIYSAYFIDDSGNKHSCTEDTYEFNRA